EHGRGVYRLTIVSVLDRPHRNRPAYGPIGLARDEVVARGCDDLTRHLVVRPILSDRILYILIEGVPPLDVSCDVRRSGVVLVEIAKEHGPFVDKLRRPDQRIDESVSFRGVRIVNKSHQIRWRGNPSGKVQRDTTKEFNVGCQWRRLNSSRSHSPKDRIIDE